MKRVEEARTATDGLLDTVGEELACRGEIADCQKQLSDARIAL